MYKLMSNKIAESNKKKIQAIPTHIHFVHKPNKPMCTLYREEVGTFERVNLKTNGI